METVPADESGRELVESQLDVDAPLVALLEAAELGKPGQRALHHPAHGSQMLARFDAAPRNAIDDPRGVQGRMTARVIVALVGVQLRRAPPGSAARAVNRPDGREQVRQLPAVGHIGRGQRDGEWDALPVREDMPLEARLAPVGRVGAGAGPPFFARTLALSAAARDQSSRRASPSRSRST